MNTTDSGETISHRENLLLTKLMIRLDDAKAAYATGGVDGARSQIKQLFDAYDELLAGARKS